MQSKASYLHSLWIAIAVWNMPLVMTMDNVCESINSLNQVHPHCQCLHNYDHFNVQCKPSWTGTIVIQLPNELLSEEKAPLRIDCQSNNNLTTFNELDIPQLPLMRLQYDFILLKSCPLPTTGGISSILDRLHQRDNAQFLEIDYLGIVRMLNESFFYGCRNLVAVSITANNLLYIHRHFLKDISHINFFHLTQSLNTTLAEEFFGNCDQLSHLDLRDNNIKYLPDQIFKPLIGSLQYLWLDNNYLNVLPQSIQNLTNLVTLSVLSNQLKVVALPASALYLKTVIFSENPLLWSDLDFCKSSNSNVTHLYLRNTTLTSVNFSKSFKCFSFSKLKTLDLGHNNLTSVPDLPFSHSINVLKQIYLNNNQLSSNNTQNPALFQNATHVVFLNLAHNKLTTIQSHLFTRMTKLLNLDLSYNMIVAIAPNAFPTSLVRIRLAGNRLTQFGHSSNLYSTPFHALTQLSHLDLSRNLIRQFDNDLIFHKPQLQELKMSRNRISTLDLADFQRTTRQRLNIYLKNNRITFVNVSSHTDIADGTLRVHLDENPLHCDCTWFSRLTVSHVVRDIFGEPLCYRPLWLRSMNIWNVPKEKLLCPMATEACVSTSNCSCNWRPSDGARLIDCSSLQLNEWPTLRTSLFAYPYNHTVLNVNDNAIETLNGTAIDVNITVLKASHNFIDRIVYPADIKQLHHLDLSYNQIREINSTDWLEKIKNFTIVGNPLNCTCTNAKLANYLYANVLTIHNAANITCELGYNQSELVQFLNQTELWASCAAHNLALMSWWTIAVIIIGAALSLVSIAIILLRRAANKPFVFDIETDEDDNNKEFDVFVSYSHHDENFVSKNLVPYLEQHGYSVCLHHRNWIPGDFIAKQIVKSVRASRRTIVVLSNHFVGSVWGRMEFRTAHVQSIAERRTRLVVLLHGDLDLGQVHGELRSYLRTYTYLRTCDAKFWDKILRVMPKHS